MPVVALSIQQKDGSNLLLHSRANVSIHQAIELTSEFARKIGKIRAGDMGPLGPRKSEPNFAAGKFSILKHYQAAYTLVTDVYLLVIQHRDDNPFHSDYILGKAKSALEAICKDVNQLQIQKRFSDVFLSLDRIFDSSQEEALDWHNVERIHTATRARNDLLFTTEFKMPQGSYTPTDLVTPRIFGDAFMYRPEEPRSTPVSARGPSQEEIEASELAETLDETLEESELESSIATGDKKPKRKSKSSSSGKTRKTIKKGDASKDKDGKLKKPAKSKDASKDKTKKSKSKI